ncbi:kinase domain-containing protein [Xylaria scruposa]|nr:kinase domain-containing protein [Xylaria scruposa]
MVKQQYQCPDEDDIEDVEKYRRGGFHPIHIGDVLRENFRVLHKLGCGGFSTVWLARDLMDHLLYAIKVFAADAPRDELNIYHLLDAVGVHPNVSNLHGHFTIQGPNGSHQCLVLSVLGPSIKQIQHSKFTAELKQDISKQIACGLSHLHRAGICHGDLTHANVLLGLRDVSRWSDSEVYQRLGAPNTAQLLRLDGSLPPPCAPKHIVEAIQFKNIDPGLLSGSVCIVDFGLSFLTEHPPPGIPGTPYSFLAPELCFGAPRSPSNDIWALGCLIFELYTGRLLFPVIFDRFDILVGTIVNTLGRLPLHWEGHFVNQTDRIFEPGQKDFWFDPSFEPEKPLKTIAGQCPQPQKRLLLELLAGLLSLDPSNRPTAAETISYFPSSPGDTQTTVQTRHPVHGQTIVDRHSS